ncbi:MBL fold metallo-hydrolase [Pseudomonas sp. CGJS7]|uniref:MBL fold metallo-hydrolase n=1 Tax=Pseudomonas sp. CGJS7 TaxID=3109348 RepID=UPI003009CF68
MKTLRSSALSAACAIAATLAVAACADKTPTAAPAADTASASTAPAVAEPAAAPLSIEVYNPGEQAIFAVSSTLVTGAKDAVLIDAQFSTVDAAKLVERIKASGKRLTTIYISHGDPDFYFGLVALTDAFPQAKVLATPQTIAHIRETSAGKLQFWGPKLGAGAPSRIVIPEPLQGDTIDLEGNSLKIVGLDGPTPDRSFVWIEPIKAVLGGIPVMAGEHVWMADTQTPQSHADWLGTLDKIAALQPKTVVPGHFAPGAAQNLDAVRFTADYIRAFDEETAKAKDAAALIAAMQRRYPGLGAQASLELSAKVAKGEMKWP